MLITAPPDKIDSFTSLEYFVGEMICQKSRDHHVVELIFFSPEFVISHIWVSFNEKLLKRIVDFTGDHPCFDHGKNRSRYFLKNSADKVLSTGASIENIGVDS